MEDLTKVVNGNREPDDWIAKEKREEIYKEVEGEIKKDRAGRKEWEESESLEVGRYSTCFAQHKPPRC